MTLPTCRLHLIPVKLKALGFKLKGHAICCVIALLVLLKYLSNKLYLESTLFKICDPDINLEREHSYSKIEVGFQEFD